jgi:hypothetical protein
MNVYNTEFLRPVNVFPGTHAEQKIYPQPFNVPTVSGVQYDPNNPNPKILKTTVCPVCRGSGIITEPHDICITALVTWNPKEEFLDLSVGEEGESICRLKVFECDYEICKEAKSYIVDGVACRLFTPPRVKGLGGDHLVEFYLQTTAVDKDVTDKYENDSRVKVNPIGRVSDQAPPSTPTIPPSIPGDDVW